MRPRTTMTRQEKLKILHDWAAAFPAYREFPPSELIRRVGPLGLSIALYPKSGAEYLPEFLLHNLAFEFDHFGPACSESLRTRRTNAPDHIVARLHDERFPDAALRFREQAPLALEGSVRLDAVLAYYREYVQRATVHFPMFVYADELALLTWCGRHDEARARYAQIREIMLSWPENILARDGGAQAWFDRYERFLGDEAVARSTAEAQARRFKVEKAPVSDLLY